MTDNRKQPRGGKVPPPPPGARPPAPPPRRPPPRDPSLSGSIEIEPEPSFNEILLTPLPRSAPSAPTPGNHAAIPSPPPPPPPRRPAPQPSFRSPANEESPRGAPRVPFTHRIGIDPTLAQQRRPTSPARAVAISETAAPARAAMSLFHNNVVASDSGPIAPVPTSIAERARRMTPVDTIWDGEVRILQREVSSLRSREAGKAALLLGAQAAISLGARGDRSAARTALEDSLTLSEERFSLYLLRREALVDRQLPRALELGHRELERVVDPKERIALLLQLGVLEESLATDEKGRTAARKAFEAMRELDARSTTALLALVDRYFDDAQWEPLAATYHALADASAEPTTRGMFRHAAGVIEERELDDPKKARATFHAALEEDASNLPAVVSLSSLALRTEDWAELARALEAEADRLEDTSAQRRLYERAGDLHWERLSDAEAAATAYRKAAMAAPDASGPLRRLAAVLESIGRWHELVDVLNAELPLTRSPEGRAELHHLVGEVKENHLERHDEALSAYEAALAEVPDHVASLLALSGLFARTRRLDSLMRAELGEAERMADPMRRASRYLHLGDLAAHVVGDEPEALRLYERCVELEPGHRAAFQGLEAIYRRRGDSSALASLYERQAESTASPSLKRLYFVSAARSLLDADRHDDARSLAPNFLQRVEKLLRAAQAIAADDLTPLYTLADALEDAGQWEPLVAALERFGEKLDEPKDQIALLHRVARILELRLGADTRALTTYEQILQREPLHEAALLAVVRLHQRAGRSALEIEALGRLRDRASSASEGASLSYRIGRIQERRIGDAEAAVIAYEEALARKPDFAPSLRALERLLRRDRRWPRLVEVLERQLGSARTPAERAELRYAIGQVEELHLRNLERAEESYAAALREAPTNDPVIAALAQVREARKDTAGLSQLLDEQRRRVRDPNSLVALLQRLGTLAEGPLADPARAIEMYTQAIAASPLGVRLHASLIRVTRKHAGTAAGNERLRMFADAVGEPRLKAAALILCSLRDEAGADAARAFSETVIGPRDSALLDGKIRRAMAASAPALGETSLAELLSERARIVDTTALKALLHLEAACRFDRAGQPRESGAALEAADLAVNDLLPVLRGVRRIAVQGEQWSNAVVLYSHEAELSSDLDNRTEALMQAGDIALNNVGDARQALEHFRRLLGLQPLHQQAFERATWILERAKDWQGIASLYRARAEAAVEPTVRGEAWRRKAEIERDRLRDVPAALASLRAGISACPDDLESYKAIAPLQEHQRFWQDAIETYRKIAELSHGDDLSRAARIREADLREHELGDRDGARQILAELVTDPSDRDAAKRLAALCERMARWDEAKALWAQLANTRDANEQVDALVALGSVIERGTQDIDLALVEYQRAIDLVLATPELLNRVETRFREAGQLLSFTEAGERALEAITDAPGTDAPGTDAPGQLELRRSLARVYIDDLQRPDLAEHQLSICAELAPNDTAAFLDLGQLLIEMRRPEQALPMLHRALDLNPSSAEALRALGAGLGQTGLGDAARIFESAAAFIEGASPPAPTSPLPVRRALLPDEWQTYFPRESGPGKVALSELARTLDAFAPQLVVELTGERPRGELLPPGKADTLVRSTFQALGMTPLRIFVDKELGSDMVICADDALAIHAGPGLLRPEAAGRLVFELTRIGAWIAQGESLGTFLRGRALPAFIQAACDDGGDEEVREVRRRVTRALPRKLRKELERFAIPLADSVGVAKSWERSGYAAAEELGLLICRDAGAVFESLGHRPGEPLPVRGRGVEIVRFMASEDCWRAYRRLVDG